MMRMCEITLCREKIPIGNLIAHLGLVRTKKSGMMRMCEIPFCRENIPIGNLIAHLGPFEYKDF